MPLGLAAKLVGALALCFGALVCAAWALKRRWPGLARLAASGSGSGELTIIETRGLAPGSALHLLEVDGTRILLLQTRERGDVLWTRESGEGVFEEPDGGAGPAARKHTRAEPGPATAAAAASKGPTAKAAAAVLDTATWLDGSNDEAARRLRKELEAHAARARKGPVKGPAKGRASGSRGAAGPLRSPGAEARRLRTLLQAKERQRRFRERARRGGTPRPRPASAGRRP